MRFLIVSDRGSSAGLIVRLKQEGHEVYVYFKEPRARVLLKGIADQVGSIDAGVQKSPDVIVFDMVGYGKVADGLRSEGWRVFGGGAWNDKLELDRAFSVRTMEIMGIRAPVSYAFKSFMEAARFAAKQSRRLVFKSAQSCTYVPETTEELVSYITHLKKDVGVDGACVLQDCIKGTEISTEVWFSKGQPVPYPNGTIETKRLLRGDLGPETGTQSSLVWFYEKKEPRIIQQSLKKLYPLIEKIKYTGPININGIVRKGRFYGLGFEPRLGYSAIYALMRLLDEPLGDLLYRLTEGDVSPVQVQPGFGYSLRVSIPPYPVKAPSSDVERQLFSTTRGQLIGGLSKKEWSKAVFPLDVYGNALGLFTAGFNGAVCECTGYGLDPHEAQREAEEGFYRLRLPHKMARLSDPVRIALNRFNELEQMGYDVPRPAPLVELSGVATR